MTFSLIELLRFASPVFTFCKISLVAYLRKATIQTALRQASLRPFTNPLYRAYVQLSSFARHDHLMALHVMLCIGRVDVATDLLELVL